MTRANIARLADRGVLSVTGPDALKLLQGLVTNDLDGLGAPGARRAAHAALLTPQGKMLFEFFVTPIAGGYLIETAADKTADLAKRLAMYKLRADVAIKDASAEYLVLALWGPDAASSGETVGTVSFQDPRHPELGLRILAEASFATDIASATNGAAAAADEYHAHRVALGVPEAGRDYPLGDTFPHEADMDLLHGVSFTKGCYVGQEVVSRMEHRGTARKRVTRIEGAAPLTTGADVKIGDVVIGSVGTIAGNRALAMLKLDRVVDALDRGHGITADGVPVTVDPGMVARMRAKIAEKAQSG